MLKVLNRSDLKARRQSLRKNSPIPELVLWKRLRARQLNGYKFRRQYSIGAFIVDFYCPDQKLVVEIDGDSHYRKEAKIYDLKREQFIKCNGIRTARFTNNEVTKNLGEVLENISRFLIRK